MKRVIISFLLKQLLLLIILYVALSLDSNLNLKGTDDPVIIKIGRGNPTTKMVEIDCPNNCAIAGGRKVKWRVDSSSNVNKFRIWIKDRSRWGFRLTDFPPRLLTREGTGRLKDSEESYDYEYKIIWTDKSGGGEYTHDPKIAIKPGTKPKSLEQFIYIVYALLAGLISFLTFRNR